MFYPGDWTFVCPTEIHAFSDRIQEFKDLKTEVSLITFSSNMHASCQACPCVTALHSSPRRATSHTQRSESLHHTIRMPRFAVTRVVLLCLVTPHVANLTRAAPTLQVVGVSVDSAHSHLAWANAPRNKGGLGGCTFPLLGDITKRVSSDYGVLW